MQVTIYHVVARFEHKSGKVEDQVMNTFTFNEPGNGVVLADMLDIGDALGAFYATQAPVGGHSVAEYLAPSLSRVNFHAHFDFYDVTAHLDGSSHGSPVRIQDITLPAVSAGAVGIPSEVAICLSYHGDTAGDSEELGGTRPRSRKRGRLFIGPLVNIVYETEAVTSRVRVTQQARETLGSAASRLMSDPNTNWVVWSRANAAVVPVTGGFVDDAFDVQRRRGEDSSLRYVWPG